MPANNSLTDIKYKIILRARAEWELTQFTVMPDNPSGLTSAEVTAFKAYRAAWQTLIDGDMSAYKIDSSAEMLISGITIPTYPDGWSICLRVAGDLPPILCRDAWMNLYDPSFDGAKIT